VIEDAAERRFLILDIQRNMAELASLNTQFRQNRLEPMEAVEAYRRIADDLWGCHTRLSDMLDRMKAAPLQVLAGAN
jgi:hypothetical protein